MIGKIIASLIGVFASQGTTANKAVGVLNGGIWLALIPLAGYVWHYRNELVTFQASVGAIAIGIGIAWAFVSTVIAIAQKSSPTPPYYPTSKGE